MRRFALAVLSVGVIVGMPACLWPSLDGMSGGSGPPPLPTDLPTSGSLPPDAPPLRVIATDTTASALVDNAFRVDFAAKTSWEPNGLASVKAGLDVTDLAAPWLSVVAFGFCSTTTGICSATSILDNNQPTPKTTMVRHQTDARMTLEATWSRNYYGKDVHATERFTVFPSGRMHVSFVVATAPAYGIVSTTLEYGRLQMPAATPWIPFTVASAAALSDEARMNVLVAAPTTQGVSPATQIVAATPTTPASVLLQETKVNPVLGITREFDVVVGTSGETPAIVQAARVRSLTVDGDGSWGALGFYDSATGMYSVSAKAQAARIGLHLSGRSPGVRIGAWSASIYTVSVDGTPIATSTHPSTQKAVTAIDTDGALEIALAGDFDGSEVIEVLAVDAANKSGR